MPTNIEQNRFYQMHDAMAGGYLPDVQRIYPTLKQAKRAARERVKREYRGDDNLKVLGNPEAGYEIIRKDGPHGEQLHRIVDVHGPLGAEEMGYDDLEHCIRHNELEHMKGAQKVLD